MLADNVLPVTDIGCSQTYVVDNVIGVKLYLTIVFISTFLITKEIALIFFRLNFLFL